jgi:predicted MPP superfamily phosphohydrolase
MALLVLFALGELRQLWLRHTYLVHSHAGANLDWLRPVTTTALAVRRFDVAVRGLRVPRLRAVHVTDLHITEALPEGYYRAVLDAIAAQDADLLLFTGDSLSQAHRLGRLEEWLSALPRVRHGAFGVLGNHEHWASSADQVRRAFERAGVAMLAGRCVSVAVSRDAAVRVCGTEAPWGPELPHDVLASDSTPTLVLSHTPDNVYALSESGADVVFAGHTHGGQARLPLLGALIVPSVYGRRFDLGHFRVNGSQLLVSAGGGADAPAFRVWCRPELLVVDLHPE